MFSWLCLATLSFLWEFSQLCVATLSLTGFSTRCGRCEMQWRLCGFGDYCGQFTKMDGCGGVITDYFLLSVFTTEYPWKVESELTWWKSLMLFWYLANETKLPFLTHINQCTFCQLCLEKSDLSFVIWRHLAVALIFRKQLEPILGRNLTAAEPIS